VKAHLVGLNRFIQGSTSLLVMVMELRDVDCGTLFPQIIIRIDVYMEQ
jgi:hypothetical protein